MTDVLTLWIELPNEINRNALSGYQASDLGEMGDNLVHSGLKGGSQAKIENK